MVALLARCTGSVVAAGASGGCREGAVVNLGTTPGGGRLVAALAVARHCGMHGSSGLAGQSVAGAQVAACALCAQGDVLVQQSGVPAGVASLVASVAVVDRHARQ